MAKTKTIKIKKPKQRDIESDAEKRLFKTLKKMGLYEGKV